jgi:ribosomal-protein-alanine N-acetyltransferase
MKIRKAEMIDAALLMQLDQACFQASWTLKSWKDSLGMEHYQCFLIEEEGVPAGFQLISCAADEGEVLKIGVLKEYRGRRLAGHLLEAAYEYWKARKVTSVFLEVRESNHSARKLYASKGFTEAGIRKNYYHDPTEHAVICICDL